MDWKAEQWNSPPQNVVAVLSVRSPQSEYDTRFFGSIEMP